MLAPISAPFAAGDLKPSTPLARALTVIIALLGFLMVFSEVVKIAQQTLTPIAKMARSYLVLRYPPKVEKIRGADGTVSEITVPMRVVPYFAFNLAPSLALFSALQVLFAALLCAAQPIDYGTALYNMMITSTTVGLGDVPIDADGRHPWAKVVVIVHILLTVGTLSTIFAEAKELSVARQKQVDRLLLMMKKNDPSVLLSLQESHAKAVAAEARERNTRTSRLSRGSRSGQWGKLQGAVAEGRVGGGARRRLSICTSSLYGASLSAAAREGAPMSEAAPASAPEGLDKTEFVVAMLVQLGVLDWAEALPVMRHFDILDSNHRGYRMRA